MVSGYIVGKTATVSTSVAYFWQINQEDAALDWVIVNLGVSLIFMIMISAFEKKKIRG
jgi:molybdate transport system permease protein